MCSLGRWKNLYNKVPAGEDCFCWCWKAEAYERGLGFNKANAESLISQIDDAVKNGTNSPIEIITSEFGIKYKFRIPVKGINGMIKNVIAVYQIDAGSEIPRLITNFLEGK